MAEDSDQQQDRWSDWLTKGRQRGLDDKQVTAMNRGLGRLAKRVVKEAKIRPGQRILDVGAGTGLLALEAGRRLKAEGIVVASDISHDALVHCRDAAMRHADGARLVATVGDALALPFGEQTFDVALTRSVFIYLDDKLAGVRELFRVLKPGGRVSIFEPINEVWDRNAEREREVGTYDSFRPTYDRILEHYRSSRSSTLLGWDERDLLGWFEDAGFSNVTLHYEHFVDRPAPPKRVTEAARSRQRRMWKMRPNPHDPSFEELVRSMLGHEADAYLERYLAFLLATPPRSARAVAYLTATR